MIGPNAKTEDIKVRPYDIKEEYLLAPNSARGDLDQTTPFSIVPVPMMCQTVKKRNSRKIFNSETRTAATRNSSITNFRSPRHAFQNSSKRTTPDTQHSSGQISAATDHSNEMMKRVETILASSVPAVDLNDWHAQVNDLIKRQFAPEYSQVAYKAAQAQD